MPESAPTGLDSAEGRQVFDVGLCRGEDCECRFPFDASSAHYTENLERDDRRELDFLV